jgi:spore germination cell wall hydrolase CwlJ-like protein
MTTTMLSVTEPQIETSVITEIETERTTQSIIYIEPVVSIIETPVVTTQVITIPVPVEVTNNGRLYNLTDSEIEAIAYITQAEAGSEIEAGKIAVVHCILNRVASSLYPNDVIGVISAPNQFSTYYNYLYRTSVPTEDTLTAVNKALEMYDSVGGATSFYAPRSCYSAWHESMQYCTTIGNHKFFKNW